MSVTDLAITDRPRPKGAAFDPVFQWVCAAAATTLLAALTGIVVLLAIGGWPALSKFGLSFFTSTDWNPVTDVFGGEGPIVGTLVTSFMALLFSLPIAFGVAVFLVEFCPRILRRPIGVAVELLAAVPSIVYGMWGLFVFAPFFATYVEVPAMSAAQPGSLLEMLTQGVPNGANILTASIVLAIMILPYMAAVLRELFLTVPVQLRESGYGMGSTTLEAVTSIIGNSHTLPKSFFDSGSTIASTIANEFNEATTPMYTSALIALGFVLFLISFVVLAIARALLGSEKAV